VLAVALVLGCGALGAQQSNPLERPPGLDAPQPPPSPRPSPPSADPAAPGAPDLSANEPSVTIRQDGENKIEEFRSHGRLYAVRVTPRVGKPYVMVDPDGSGHMERLPGNADDPAGQSVHPPRWTLFEF
jgi:hypothetical protein